MSATFLGCSGGGGTTSGAKASPCAGATGGNTFCLVSCNLGCTQQGCSVTEIAQNQPIYFEFSHDLDAGTVNAGTISLKSPTGEEPVGVYLVDRNLVQFVPEVRVVGASTFFGFRANEQYVMTLNGGEQNINALRNTSGTPLRASMSCTLNVSRGIIDLDQQPPSATLVSPSVLTGVEQDVTIVVEFSEFIDQTPFNGSGPSPMLFRVRKTRIKNAQTGERECSPVSTSIALLGSPRVANDSARQRTVVTFKALDPIPGEHCVEVEVTNRITDLAGTPALGQIFQFITKAVPITEKSIPELFANANQLDQDVSSGTWGGGQALPGQIGGDGLHGDFDLKIEGIEETSPGNYLFRTTPEIVGTQRKVVKISKDRALDGADHEITDGVARFSSFKLPSGTTLTFKGTLPPRIYVRGKAEILGKILLNGASFGLIPGSSGPWDGISLSGQPGSAAGPGGGNGGQGGDKADGLTLQTRFHGRPGEDAKLLAGHAYAARAAGTGGRGSLMMPTSGLFADVTFLAYTGLYSDQVCAGGGGGGYDAAGAKGTATLCISGTPASLGPASVGGLALDLFPFPPPGGASSFDHFVVGGSGGGGAGASPFFQQKLTPPTIVVFKSGGAGAGGGGAIALRVGRDMTMSSAGRIEAIGGSACIYANVLTYTSTGGGGSGGSILLQVGAPGFQALSGTLSVLGGAGGILNTAGFATRTDGGAGSPGYIRLEVPNPSPTLLPNAQPPATAKNVATLTETDPLVASQSRWYATHLSFPPEFVRYEIRATVDSQDRLYSDDPSLPGAVPAFPGEAVRLLIQGALLDQNGVPEPNSISAWLKYVGSHKPGETSLNDRSPSGFRFVLMFDRSVATNIVVKSVTVFFRS